jgi:TonB family protein
MKKSHFWRCRRNFAWAALGCLVATLLLGSHLVAQSDQSTGTRKVISKVAPIYPEDLKKHDIGGTVRLTVVISSRGNVERVSPIGGNPILVDAAVLAVKKWKYEPADTSTSTEVQISFIPRR